MSRFLLIPAFVLAGCVQPPLPPSPPVYQPPQPEVVEAVPPPTVPRYPTWDEVGQASATLVATPADPSVPASGGQPLIGGASLHHASVSSVEFEIVLFDSRNYELKVIDQPQDYAGGGQIGASMRKVGAIAGVNGGFFTPKFVPMGLMTADGRSTGSWQVNKLLTGAVVVRGGPKLLWNAEARSRSGALQFLQAGPRLVDAGRAVASLERSKHVARTFIAHDGGQRWIFGLARSTSLGELAEILATAELVPGLRIQRALNLDGGRSSALYYRTADGQEHSNPGWSTVRNYLGIVPR